MREDVFKRLERYKTRFDEYKTKKTKSVDELNGLIDELNNLSDELNIFYKKRLIDREFSKYTIEDKQSGIDEYYKI